MAYANNTSGDVVVINAIVDTVKEKSVLVPGIITNPDLQVSVMGEVAAFYTASKSSVAEGQVGGKVDYEVSGGKRHDVNLTKALHIGKIFPRAMYATVTPDIILKASVTETIRQTNKHNELGLRALEAAAEAKTLSAATDAWEQFVDAIAEFKMDNANNGFAPTGVLMSPKFAAQIKLDQRFLIGVDRDSIVRTGFLGRVDGVDVIETLDLAEGFILVNSEGCPKGPKNVCNPSPTSICDIAIVDAPIV